MRIPLIVALVFTLVGCTTRPFNPDDVGEGEGEGGEGEGEGECPDLNPLCRSASDNLCITFQECADEADPVQACVDAKADQSADDRACAAACKAEGDAYAQCYLVNGTCQDAVLTLEPSDACDDQFNAFSDCAKDNC